MNPALNQELRCILLKKQGSLSQQTIADLCGVSQATVSGWFSGYKRPRLSHLVNLARVIGVDPIELAKAANYNPQEVYKLYNNSQIYPEDIDFAKNNLKSISQLHISGNNTLALNMLKELLDWINIKLRQFSSSLELLDLKANLLLDMVNIYNEILLPKDFMKNSGKFLEEVENISRTIGNAELFYMAGFMRGDGKYLLSDYASSAHKILVCLDYIKKVDNRLWALRTLALDYAYLNELSRFKKVYNEITGLIEDGNFKHPEIVCMTYEGLGRAQVLLRLSDDINILNNAWSIYKNRVKPIVKCSPILEIGLKRSMIEIILKTQPNESSLLEKIGTNIIHISEQFSYPRYVLKTQELLKKHL